MGGTGNLIEESRNSAVAGGVGNYLLKASETFVGGGRANYMFETTAGVIGGGRSNRLSLAGLSVIGGGLNNQVSESGTVVIAGGQNNTVTLDAAYSVIGGGFSNRISSPGSAPASTIAGGQQNEVRSEGGGGTIGGGASNLISGARGMVPGGRNNEAGADAFAAGTRARAVHRGAFVWADATDADVFSSGNNSFVARAAGGVTFYSDAAGSAGVVLPTGAGAWASLSDRAAKENVAPVDVRAVLDRLVALPLGTWNYKTQPAHVRHLGPMAQDFAAAFGLGEDERRISTVDADGVALAAIQGLHAVVKEKDARIAALEDSVAELRKLVETLVKQGGRQ